MIFVNEAKKQKDLFFLLNAFFRKYSSQTGMTPNAQQEATISKHKSSEIFYLGKHNCATVATRTRFHFSNPDPTWGDPTDCWQSCADDDDDDDDYDDDDDNDDRIFNVLPVSHSPPAWVRPAVAGSLDSEVSFRNK